MEIPSVESVLSAKPPFFALHRILDSNDFVVTLPNTYSYVLQQDGLLIFFKLLEIDDTSKKFIDYVHNFYNAIIRFDFMRTPIGIVKDWCLTPCTSDEIKVFIKHYKETHRYEAETAA